MGESLTGRAHLMIRERFKSKAPDFCLDATLGNGHDALFLASILSNGGELFGFDIQSRAIEASRALLSDNGFAGVGVFFECSHDKMSERLPRSLEGKLDCAIFNLGWLPKSDKRLKTNAYSTVAALGECLKFLREGSVLSVTAYPGHEGGADELSAVEEFMRAQNFNSLEEYRDVGNAKSPVLFFAVK